MFEALAEAIEELEVPPRGDALAEAWQHHQRLTAKLTLAAAALDASGDWAADGSASMTSWLRVHTEVTNAEAARVLRIGRRLRTLPHTAGAWVAGTLSDGQIDVIVANVTERRAALFAEHESELVGHLARLDVAETVRAMQDWAARADAILDEDEPPAPKPAEVQLVKTLDGRGYLRGTFDAEETEVIATGLRLADSGDRDLPYAERQGQAMVDVFRWFLDHQGDKLAKRHRPHVNVVIDLPDLLAGGPGRTLEGIPLDAASLRRLLCDANVHRVITDGRSSILDYGHATRTIPPAVYTSLVLRDLGCRFPGCDRNPEWCHGHHVIHWEDGGPTCLSNLVLLCELHHHRVHLRGWHLKLLPTGTVEVTAPDGTVRTGDPPLLC